MPVKLLSLFFLGLIAAANFAFAEAGKTCPPVAEKPTAETTQAAMRAARDHGFLWRISKDGHSSFLYGTIHVGKFEWLFPGPVVMQALRASDTLALELDMADADIQHRLVKGLAQLSHTPLPDALQTRMRQQAELVCLPYQSLAPLTPEFQVETLAVMAGNWDKLYAAYAIDTALAGIARSTKMAVVSLETPEMQLQLLQMKDSQETILYVQDSLDELETGHEQAMLRRIAKIWEDSDYTGIAHFNEWCECLNTEAERGMMTRLLDDRNPNLADRIDAMHSSGKQVFAAVGSLHMFGAIGLPALMEKRGYRVERIDFSQH